MNFAPDIVGIGQNAVDVLILADHYPAYTGKVRFHQEIQSPGGQVATAIAACAKLGLRTKYVGTVGNDALSAVQRASLETTGIDISDLLNRDGATQSGYIAIDKEG